VPILGVLLLLLAIRLVREDRVDAGRALVLGLVGGLAWWTQLLLVSYLLVAGVFVVVRRPSAHLLREGGMILAGFALGSVPFWLYTLGQPAALGLVGGAQSPAAWGDLVAIVREDLPFALGASAAWPSPAVNHAVLGLLALVYLPVGGFLLYEGLRGLWVPRSLGPRVLLPLTAVAIVFVDAASGYRSAGGFKYLFPLYRGDAVPGGRDGVSSVLSADGAPYTKAVAHVCLTVDAAGIGTRRIEGDWDLKPRAG
jgi:hypothetical protein